jgi:hypothetical protein
MGIFLMSRLSPSCYLLGSLTFFVQQEQIAVDPSPLNWGVGGGLMVFIEIRLLIEKGPIYLADVLAMDNSNVGAAPRLFCGFFLK